MSFYHACPDAGGGKARAGSSSARTRAGGTGAASASVSARQEQPGAGNAASTASRASVSVSSETTAKLITDHAKSSPDNLAKALTGGVPLESAHFSSSGKRLSFNANISGGGTIIRHFDLESKNVDHAYFRLPRSEQGSGTGKTILASQIATYQKMNMKTVSAHANIDVGSYTWAKFGFVPNQQSWNVLRGQLEDKLSRTPNVDKASKAQALAILKTRDPKALWALSDMPNKGLAKSLLMNEHWHGTLDFGDKTSMTRFNKYVGKVSTTPPPRPSWYPRLW